MALAICRASLEARDLLEFRQGVLGLLKNEIEFDRALFHELSPRAALAGAALVGLDPMLLREHARHWDETAVELGRLRELALAHAGVISDAEAFPPRSAGRRKWEQRVGKPLGVARMCAVHLIVHSRIISAVLLFRCSDRPFQEQEQSWLRGVAPALATGDALQQALKGGVLRGLVDDLRCEDQRLTPRQQALVVRVALGHTNREIALSLNLSEHTVRNQLVDVRARLGAANRAEIVRLAVLR
jgi:DNA-binding CsgD family transcriptional regulator